MATAHERLVQGMALLHAASEEPVGSVERLMAAAKLNSLLIEEEVEANASDR